MNTPSSKRIPNFMNRRIGKAMHDYSMLADGDNVLVAVSGGIDSLFLLQILHSWRSKAPVSYQLEAVHVAVEAQEQQPVFHTAEAVKKTVEQLGVALTVLPLEAQPSLVEKKKNEQKDVCFHCARSRRTRLFSYAREHGFTTLALGHHRDDIIETFFLNLTCSGNISTMRPKQELFDGRLSVIRPLSYCDKSDIEQAAITLNLRPVKSFCPLSGKTRRRNIQKLVQMVYEVIPDAKEHIFSALGNVRQDYLLNSKPSS